MSGATDRMRELLDERGVEWGNIRDDGSESDYLTEWQFENNQGKAIAVEWSVGSGLSVETHRYHLTPEQAIAATLGAVEYRKPTTLSQLEAENAKLREQMERLVTLLRNDCDIDASWDGLRGFWLIGLTENGCLMRDRACKAEAENAKLRELLHDFLSEHADYFAEENYFIGDLDLEHAMHHNQAYFRREAKKLGVEVDG